MTQLQTYQDKAVHLMSLAEQGEHYSEKQPRGPSKFRKDQQFMWKNLSTGKQLVVHSIDLSFMEAWQEVSHC